MPRAFSLVILVSVIDSPFWFRHSDFPSMPSFALSSRLRVLLDFSFLFQRNCRKPLQRFVRRIDLDSDRFQRRHAEQRLAIVITENNAAGRMKKKKGSDPCASA